VNSLKTFRYNCSNSKQIRAFRSPVTTWTATILFSSKNYCLLVGSLIFLCCVKNVKDFSRWHMKGLWANFRHHFVDDPDISECSPSHYQVISSSRAVGVEIFLLDTFSLEETGSWRWDGNVSSRRDMICCDWIPKNCQNVSISDGLYLWQFSFSMFKERRIMNISRFFLPSKVHWFRSI